MSVFRDKDYELMDKARRELLDVFVGLGLVASGKTVQQLIDGYGIEVIDEWTLDIFTNDSLEVLQIIVDLEERLDIELPEEKLGNASSTSATLKTFLTVVVEAMKCAGG